MEVAQGGGTGKLLAEVHTVGNGLTTDQCEVAQQFWGMRGECQVVGVGAAQVGVVVRPTHHGQFDQWAAYRHPDGVVVFVAQAAQADGARPLGQLPLSVAQLAELAASDRFHLT